MEESKKAGFIRNMVIAIILAVLTAVEIWVAINIESVVWLILIALIKASLVIYFFMHVYRLWREEEHS